MLDLKLLNKQFSGCDCGREHLSTIKDIRIGSKLVNQVGSILKANSFSKKLLLVADKNTFKAASGIEESLQDFKLKTMLYNDFRIPSLEEVERITALADDAEGVLVIGTGSLSDVCRLAAFRKNLPLCIFATAASMDGFASSASPIIDSGFKRSFPAKAPAVIIADTDILAAAPSKLKAAGFGDMVGKYVALIDWEASHILTGEYFCKNIATLTKQATDTVFKLAPQVQKNGDVSGQVFEALLLTGIAMSYANNSRPASGAEHMLAHFWECLQIASGKIPEFHGAYVGVATLLVARFYNKLAKIKPEEISKKAIDKEEIYGLSGILAPAMRKLNKGSNIPSLEKVKTNWQKIKNIILAYPGPEEIFEALKEAGSPTTTAEVVISDDLKRRGWISHPFIRNRFTLTRLMSHYNLI